MKFALNQNANFNLNQNVTLHSLMFPRLHANVYLHYILVPTLFFTLIFTYLPFLNVEFKKSLTTMKWPTLLRKKLRVKGFVRLASRVDFANIYAQLLRAKIPKAKKYSQTISLFSTFGICARKNCAKNVGKIGS